MAQKVRSLKRIPIEKILTLSPIEFPSKLPDVWFITQILKLYRYNIRLRSVCVRLIDPI